MTLERLDLLDMEQNPPSPSNSTTLPSRPCLRAAATPGFPIKALPAKWDTVVLDRFAGIG